MIFSLLFIHTTGTLQMLPEKCGLMPHVNMPQYDKAYRFIVKKLPFRVQRFFHESIIINIIIFPRDNEVLSLTINTFDIQIIDKCYVLRDYELFLCKYSIVYNIF